MKKALIIFASVVLLIVPLLSPVKSVEAQQDPPRWDCCFHLYSVGSNLGWGSSLLNYTYVRTRLEPADETIFENLSRAGQHVEAAYKTCSRINPAWRDWANKQRYLSEQVNAIRQRPDTVIRRQVASSIASTYLWGQALRVRIFGDQVYEHDTCAEKYFRLGFLLGYAQQTLGIAEEIQQSGRNDYLTVTSDAHQYLRQSLQVLNEYFGLAGCTEIRDLDLPGRITNLLKMDSRSLQTINPEMRAIWQSLQQRLTQSCDSATGPGPRRAPPRNNVTYFTDPTPTVSVISIPGGSEIILRKELSGYGGYGAADGRADILYTGEVATWNFALPLSLVSATVQRAFFRTSLIADDHYNLALDRYNLAVWSNGNDLGSNPANLPHGSPYGGRFVNWVRRDYTTTVSAPPYSITLSNTSGVSNWLGVDWIELHLVTR